MGMVKTCLSSTVIQKKLSNDIYLHCHRGKTDNIDLLTVARDFLATKETKSMIFILLNVRCGIYVDVAAYIKDVMINCCLRNIYGKRERHYIGHEAGSV